MGAYKKYPTVKKKRLVKSKVFWLVVIVVVLLLAGGGFAYKRHHDKTRATNTHVTPKPVTDKTKNSAPATTTPSDNSTNSKNNTSTPSTTTPTSPTTNLPVAKPFGSFVSNHKPGQNGSPLEEASTCSTTAGISCSITFTKAGVTKSLPAKTTDSAGTAYWQWTPQSIGLTTGNWTVTAVATNGQQTESTTDSIPLQVL